MIKLLALLSALNTLPHKLLHSCVFMATTSISDECCNVDWLLSSISMLSTIDFVITGNTIYWARLVHL